MQSWKNHLGIALVLGSFLAAVACGGDDKGSSAVDPNHNKVSPGGLGQRLAEIQCAGEAKCCPSPGRDVTACITAQKAFWTTAMIDSIAADPAAGFDATRAQAAFNEFERLATACDTSIAAYAASPDGLRGIAQGTVATGGTCNPPPGSADPVKIGVALASCKGPAAQACVPAATGDWKCTALADSGGACYTDVNCKVGLFCDNPNLDIAGATCKPRKAAAAPCTLPNECDSFSCKNGTCAAKSVEAAYCLK